MKRILCFMSVNPEYLQFAVPELKSILIESGIPLEILLQDELKGMEIKQHYEINHSVFKNFPFIVLNVPDFEKHKEYFSRACKTAVMIYKIVLLIGEGDNYEDMLKRGDEDILKEFCRNKEDLVMCEFNSRNRVIDREEQTKKIHSVLGGFDVKGIVNFKTPKIRYQLMENHIWYQHHHLQTPESTLRHVFFGIQLCCNMIATAKFNNAFELNKRIYLGPTSTHNDLAFLMCNQALVKPGSIIIDPFCGTGGLLIAPASKGAITFGSDLDIRVLNGYAVGRINKKSPYYDANKKFQLFTPKIILNFQQYGFPTPNLIRIDSTKLTLRCSDFFDAIITDPPYGIRAMSRTVTTKGNKQTQQRQQIKQPEKEEKQPEVEEKEKSEQPNLKKEENSQQSQEQIPNEKQQESLKEGVELTEAQKQNKEFKKQRRRVLRDIKRKKKEMLPEDEKQFKKDLMEKMNKQRVQQWEKFDRGKIETTEREKIFYGLLNFARKYLRKEGRLVFLYPVYEEEEYKGAQNLPKHEGFKLIDLSENKMSKGNSRILVTLLKI